MRETVHSAQQLLDSLAQPDGETLRRLHSIYGPHPTIVDERLNLTRRVLLAFLEQFGDRPVQLYRSPGRINLRGMHVDTHGGWMNLMTHQREVVFALAKNGDDSVRVTNVEPAFDEVEFRIADQAGHPAFGGEWLEFITAPDIQRQVMQQRGHWGHYVRGAVLRAQYEFRDGRLMGFDGVVGSDVPRGASLSSSAALVLALLHGTLGRNKLVAAPEAMIQLGKDAEWYTGSRCGHSDQCAMVAGQENQLVHLALNPSRIDISDASRVAWPDSLAVLVINSHTKRSLSGDEMVEYTRNRFAYSLALDIFRQELARTALPEELIASMDRLSNIQPDIFSPIGGERALYELLMKIPTEIDIATLGDRYALPELDAVYMQYFGAVPEEKRPSTIGLRGPLMFGIAESERARHFASCIHSGDFAEAGRLMTIGHDGDRCVFQDGRPFVFDIGNEALIQYKDSALPIHYCAGAYGASSPVLDGLVDAAIQGGALGASLTGGGIAGAVLALCRPDSVESVTARIRAQLESPYYQQMTGRDMPLTRYEIDDAIVRNHATAGAGALLP